MPHALLHFVKLVCLLCVAPAPRGFALRRGAARRSQALSLPNRSVAVAFPKNEPAIYRQKLNNLNNVQYHGKITVGGQTLFGVMDTGSFDLLVLSAQCQNNKQACPAVLKYDQSKSNTFREQGVRYEHCYVSGCATSELGFEKVQVGPLATQSQAFWQIIGHELPIINNAGFQAIVGLGIRDSPTLNMPTSKCSADGAQLVSFGFVNASEGDASGVGVMVPGNGTANDFAEVDVKGKIAIVMRGNITFDTKVRNAEAAGATGCIVVNNIDGDPEGFTLGDKDDFIPSATVRKADGPRLVGKKIRLSAHLLNHETMLQKLDVSKFAFCLEKGDGAPGWLIWGAEPDSYKNMALIEVIPNQVHWAANLSDVSMQKRDGSTVQLDVCKPWCAAVVDSGTSLITVPKGTLNEISKVVGQVPTNCQGLDALPTLRFRLGGSNFELPPEAYVVRIHVPRAKGITQKLSANRTLLAQSSDQVLCILAMQEEKGFGNEDAAEEAEPSDKKEAAQGHIWILGDPWFRHYYTVFDRAEERMLAAPAKPGCKPGVYEDPSSSKDAVNLMRNELREGEPPRPVVIDPRYISEPARVRRLLPRGPDVLLGQDGVRS